MLRNLLTIFILLLSIFIFSFSIAEEKSAAQKTTDYIVAESNQLLKGYDALLEELSNNNIEAAQKEYLKLRTHFKHIDFYMAYLDPQAFDKKINESPLPKAEPKVANRSPLEPGGMQMIDENLFSDEADVKKLMNWTKLTRQNVKQLILIHVTSKPVYDAIYIQSLKEAFVRSFTLSVTGFETPGTANIESDLASFKEALLVWQENYAPGLSKELATELKVTIEKIQPNNFEDFDRYDYLVSVVNPMLDLLEKVRLELGAESPTDMSNKPLHYNPLSTNLFNKDFLNPRVFMKAGKAKNLDKKIELGKKLFEDKGLSNSNRISCQTCHQKEKAFSDQMQFAESGDQKSLLDRNSPSISYSVYSEKFFWDLRAHDLNIQTEHVIFAPKEFNTTNEEIVAYMKSKDEYIKMFGEAFPEYPDPVHKATFALAIKEYVASLPQHNSDFDKYAQQNKQEIPSEIKKGFNLFMGKAQCATCHFPPTFAGLVPPKYKESESEVIGVLEDNDFDNPVLDDDLGRKNNGVIKDDYDFFLHAFKTPTVRNVEYSFPYMHNGSLKTLEEVVTFYNKGGAVGMGIELENQTLPFDNLSLSEEEQKQLVAFMKSLNDEYLTQVNSTQDGY